MTWPGNHPETLDGIRILDLTRLLPGPFCTALLADLGADVIKLEQPGQGDWARWVPPTYGHGATAIGALFAAINRGKRSIALDLKADEGRDLFMQLVATVDVLVESFRPGVMDRLGLSAVRLQGEHPGLIYCAITGYGQDGPYRDRAGHDLNYLALTGALDQNGPESADPHPPGFQAADVLGGSLYGALAIVAALFRRERSGQGALLDIAITDGTATLLAPLFARLDAGESLPGRGRDPLTGGYPCYNVYATKDGRHVALGALEPKFWTTFCQAIGHPEWSSQGHQTESDIESSLRKVFSTRTRDEWIQALEPCNICLEPVLSALEVLESQLMRARRIFFPLGGEGRPNTLQVATPVTPLSHRLSSRPPPFLGEHSREILEELGIAELEVERLAERGIIGFSPT